MHQPDPSASENVQQENVLSTVNEAEDNSEHHLINPDTCQGNDDLNYDTEHYGNSSDEDNREKQGDRNN